MAAKSRFRRFALIGLALALPLAFWVYLAPRLAFSNLITHARAGDTSAIEARVDFESLRQSLIRELSASAMQAAGVENPTAASIGGTMATAVVRPIVEEFVTPAGVAMIASGRAPGQAGSADAEIPAHRFEYNGLTRYSIVFEQTEVGSVTLLFRRTLTGGVLTGIDLDLTTNLRDLLP